MELLKKGAVFSLGGTEGFLQVELVWNGVPDVDLSAFLLGGSGKLKQDEDFVFYNNLSARNGAVVHSGDSSEIGSESEKLTLSLASIPEDVSRIALCISVYGGDGTGEDFKSAGEMKLCILRAQSSDGKAEELCRMNLGGHDSLKALVAGEFYRRDDEWRFRVTDEGSEEGLSEIVRKFGGDV